MNELLHQENNNYMYKMIKELDEIKDKLIKVKHYQKYKEIRKKLKFKSFYLFRIKRFR